MLRALFDVFSRREKGSLNPKRKPLSAEFRNRVLMLLRDHFRSDFRDYLGDLHRHLGYLHGKTRLADGNAPEDDLIRFLLECNDEHFFDVIEITFKAGFHGITWPSNPLIPSINQFFAVDDLPYHLTEYTVVESTGPHGGTTLTLTEHPRVVARDNQVIHQRAIEPVLHLLNSSAFKNANAEFLKALEDHRKGDFLDCLAKCGSAFESVMKVLCDKRGISYKQTDTASALLKALMSKSQLDSFWEQPLTLIATVRNRLSSAHGSGTQAKIVLPHVATYAINSTASAILLLVGEFA